MKHIWIILCVMALSACDHKEVVVDYEGEKVHFDILYNRQWQFPYFGGPDWSAVWTDCDFGIPYSDLDPAIPDGLRLLVYEDEQVVGEFNLAAEGGHVYFDFDDDDVSLIIYNNDTEYITFDDLHSYWDASASTRQVRRDSYEGSPYVPNATQTVNPPDMLYSFSVELDDVNRMARDGMHIVMQPVVYTYLIRYKFQHGLEYVAIARGALAGMATEVSLDTGEPGTTVGTVMYNCEVCPWGIQAVVRTFGAPLDYLAQTYGLNLEVRLKNGRILDFNYDVSSVVRLQPQGGVIQVSGIDIPDDVGKEDTGVFDVDVIGWDEFEDIPITF